MKVLGRVGSINVRKVLWTADHLGISYDREDWGTSERSLAQERFRTLNPNAQIPVLVDGDFLLWESHAIMRYLIEKSDDKTLLPENPQQRALVEQWFGWQATDLNFQWRDAVRALLRNGKGISESAIEKSLRDWGAKMTNLEAQLAKTRRFVAGDSFAVADISLGLSMHRWFAIPRILPEMPNCAAYLERLRYETSGGTYLTSETP